jgi:hypothetical protein
MSTLDGLRHQLEAANTAIGQLIVRVTDLESRLAEIDSAPRASTQPATPTVVKATTPPPVTATRAPAQTAVKSSTGKS